jgi:hypothetical protein
MVGLDLPDWKDVQSRNYERWAIHRLVLDTSKLSEKDCVIAIIESLAKTSEG